MAVAKLRLVSALLGSGVDFDKRLVGSLEDMARKIEHLKGLDQRIVLTSGSFDLIHLGHVKYLERAKQRGDVLVVGVDCDDKIRRRKGDDRPLVPEAERIEMLAYQRPVDLIYLKQDTDPQWALIRACAPDTLVLTEGHSYGPDKLAELEEICGEIAVLERHSSVSTSERIRQMYMDMGERLGPKLAEVLPGIIDSMLKRG